MKNSFYYPKYFFSDHKLTFFDLIDSSLWDIKTIVMFQKTISSKFQFEKIVYFRRYCISLFDFTSILCRALVWFVHHWSHEKIWFFLFAVFKIYFENEGGIGVTPLLSVFGELTARMTDSKMVRTSILELESWIERILGKLRNVKWWWKKRRQREREMKKDGERDEKRKWRRETDTKREIERRKK